LTEYIRRPVPFVTSFFLDGNTQLLQTPIVGLYQCRPGGFIQRAVSRPSELKPCLTSFRELIIPGRSTPPYKNVSPDPMVTSVRP